MTSRRLPVRLRAVGEEIALSCARQLGVLWRWLAGGGVVFVVLFAILGFAITLLVGQQVTHEPNWPWSTPGRAPNGPVSHPQPSRGYSPTPDHPERSHVGNSHPGHRVSVPVPAPGQPAHPGRAGNHAQPHHIPPTNPTNKVGFSSHKRGGAKKESRRVIIVQPGNTLWSLSGSTPHHPFRWVRLAQINHLHTPYTIYPHERIIQ